jgi:hypothetical protein
MSPTVPNSSTSETAQESKSSGSVSEQQRPTTNPSSALSKSIAELSTSNPDQQEQQPADASRPSAWSCPPPPTVFAPPPPGSSASPPKPVSPLSVSSEELEQIHSARWEAKITLLVDLGFTDIDENENLLDEHDGDVQKVIDSLLEKNSRNAAKEWDSDAESDDDMFY